MRFDVRRQALLLLNAAWGAMGVLTKDFGPFGPFGPDGRHQEGSTLWQVPDVDAELGRVMNE